MSTQDKPAANGNSNASSADRSQEQAQPDESVSGFPVYDFYSEERADLLVQLQQKLHAKEVPASFWALLQVCDLGQLEKLVKVAEIMPEITTFWTSTCSLIPRKWNQKYRGPSGSTTPVEQSPVNKKPSLTVDTQLSSSPVSDPSVLLPEEQSRREPKHISLAKKRDGGRCILTGADGSLQGAHIFPFALIKTKPAASDVGRAVPDLWDMLRAFWPVEKVNAWKSRIFSDPDSPNKMVDGPFNVITLKSHCHEDWAAGKFGLRPVSRDENEITVQFLRFPKVKHGHHDLVPLTQRPETKMDGVLPLARFQRAGEPRQDIRHGDEIKITTTDPKGLPLPDSELLDMHWKLNAVVALSAAAEAQNLYYFDDNDDDVSDAWWLGSAASSPDHGPTSQITSLPPSSPGKAQAGNAQAETEALEEIS